MNTKIIPSNYGSIPHIPGSKLGQSIDKVIPESAALLVTTNQRKGDIIIVQEKLDGSNVGVVRKEGNLIAITRSGYTALSSPHNQHHIFHDWVFQNISRFDFLKEGERLCGEWLYEAHGIKYNLPHEPFVAFDIIHEGKRKSYSDFVTILDERFQLPKLLSHGPCVSVEEAIKLLGPNGHHGATEDPEGVIYRVETKGKVNFLCKYVLPSMQCGKYFSLPDGERLNTFTNMVVV